MTVLSGLVGACITVALALLIGLYSTQNLPGLVGAASLFAIVIVAAVVGIVAGSAVGRRAGRHEPEMGRFLVLATTVAGGAAGCGLAFILTVAYLGSYTTWPQDRIDQVLEVLAYPVFGWLGLCLGGALGLFVGLLIAGLQRATAAIRQ